MALPVWPADVPYNPGADSLQPFTPFRSPLETEFNGGNVRRRARPGDNVGTIGQTVQMTAAQYDTFIAWVKDTLGNGSGRFRAQVWLGASYQEEGLPVRG